jgi:hypothetical protein
MSLGPVAAIESWVSSLPAPGTFERVRPDFWYVRIPGVARRWIPIEVEVDQRSTKLTSHVIVEPEERETDVYRLLLRRNHRAGAVAFSLDGREGVICLTGRLHNEDVNQQSLDELAGSIVQETEETFRSILGLGFASRLRRR